jgi:hypothetical protein
MMAVAEALPMLTKIQATGYWRINIRPTVFDQYRIADRSTCWQIMEDSQVSLRGWNYPHIGRERIAGHEWIESSTDLEQHVDFWRFYQSGQFIHYRAVKEDILFPQKKILGMLSTLYTLTEIFEFAGRLADRDILRPGGDIYIQLHGMNGRELAEEDRHFAKPYVAGVDPIIFHKTFDQYTLIAERDELAVNAAIHVFEMFNWETPTKSILAEDQRKLLERRL